MQDNSTYCLSATQSRVAMLNQNMALAAAGVGYVGTAENAARYFSGIGMPFSNTMYNRADYLSEFVHG